MKKNDKFLCMLLVCLAMFLTIQKGNIEIKADVEKQIVKLEETISIYHDNTTLIVETIDTNVNSVDFQNNNYTTKVDNKFSIPCGVNEFENKVITINYNNGEQLSYTLKQIPVDNMGNISTHFVTINAGEYYTHFSKSNDAIKHPPTILNHDLIIKEGGVLNVHGSTDFADGSGFAIGYAGTGSLTIEKNGIFLANVGSFHVGSDKTDNNVPISDGWIDVNGGLMKITSQHFTLGEAKNGSNAATVAGLIKLQNQGKVAINNLDNILSWGMSGVENNHASAKIEILDGEFSVNYLGEFYMGYNWQGLYGMVNVDIFLSENQAITINGNSFDSYEDSLYQLSDFIRNNNEKATSGIYYNYNWEDQKSYNFVEPTIFPYGYVIDDTFKQEWNTTTINTNIPGEYMVTANDSTAFNNNLTNNGYFEKENILLCKKVIIEKAILIAYENVEQRIVLGDSLSMPKTITLTLNNGKIIDAPITWDTTTFNNEKLGIQMINGKIDLAEFDYIDTSSDILRTAKIQVIEPILKVTGLPDEIYVEDTFTLVSNINTQEKGVGWEYDETFFEVIFNGSTIFNAKKAGETTITYTTQEGQVFSERVTIKLRSTNESDQDKENHPNNQTGQSKNKDKHPSIATKDTTNRTILFTLVVMSFTTIVISIRKRKSSDFI